MRIVIASSHMIYLLSFIVAQKIMIRRSHVVRHYSREAPATTVFKFMATAIIPLGFLQVLEADISQHTAARIAGGVTIVAGLALSLWAQHELGPNWVGGVGLHKHHQLIVTGPYGYVRHPMYSGIWISSIGISFVTLNALYSVGCILMALAYSWRIFGEEYILRERFGEQYVEYTSWTGRLIPRVTGIF